MAGLATPAGEHALGDGHALDVLGAGLPADQDDLLPPAGELLGLVRLEDHPSGGGARRGVEPAGDELAGGVWVEDGAQHHLQAGGLDAPEGGIDVDDPLVHHVHRHLHGGGGGALSRAGLQEEELLSLDGELDVLHVREVGLELLLDGIELGEDGGHGLGQGLACGLLTLRELLTGQGKGGVGAGHDIFALGIGKPLAEEDLGPVHRVAGEAHTGGAALAHIAEDHGLDVHRGAHVIGQALGAPVVAGTGVVEALEDRVDRQPKLLLGIFGEVAIGLSGDGLELADEGLQLFNAELIFPAIAAHLVDDPGEAGVVDAEDHVAEHGDEAAVAVPGEAGVAALLGQAHHGLVIQAQVEHGVHHAGHGDGGTRADAEEEGVARVAKALAHVGFERLEAGLYLVVELVGPALSIVEEVAAGLGRDGEPWGDGEAQLAHVGESLALAAEQVLVAGGRLDRAIAEAVDKLGAHGCLPRPSGGSKGWRPH